MSRLTSALAALDNARPGYVEAEAFYRGNAHETFTNPLFQKVLGSDSPEFSFNYARLVVTSRLSRMEVASITSQDGRADDVLADLWSDNLLDQELQDAFEASLVYGDAYLIGEPSEDGFDIFYNSPFDTRVFYQTENPRKKSHAVKRWVTDEGLLRVNIYTEDSIEKYISKSEVTSTYTDGDFEPYFEDGQDTWPLVNETGAIPVFHLRTGRQYGTPEHFNAYGPQRAITKLLASQMESMDYQTGPQRYMIQDAKATAGVDAQADFDEVDDEGDPISGLQSRPDGIWNLKGVSTVGQFDPADPGIFVTPFKTFIESMGTTTSTPVHTFNVGALPSGESLRAAEAPLNKRVESLELLLGATLRELHEYALETMGYTDAKVIVTWAPAATYDDADVWTTVKAKTEAGVPLRAALMEAGYTDAQVSEWYPDSETEPRTAEQLVKFADAVQKLSAAVTLGTITKEEARASLPQDILTQLPTVDPESVIEAINDSFTEE